MLGYLGVSEVVRVSVVVEMPGLPGRVGGVAQSPAEQADLLVIYKAPAVRHACVKFISLLQHFLMFVLANIPFVSYKMASKKGVVFAPPNIALCVQSWNMMKSFTLQEENEPHFE